MNEINKNNLAVRNTLYARTLGTLEILYNGEPWELPMSVKGKVMQLFLLLIWAGENGLSRVKLQDFLYDRRSTDAANALRITTTRLRKILSQSVLPLGEYVVVEKNTYYLKMGRVGENLNSRWTLLSWKIIITGLWKQKMKLHASCFWNRPAVFTEENSFLFCPARCGRNLFGAITRIFISKA